MKKLIATAVCACGILLLSCTTAKTDFRTLLGTMRNPAFALEKAFPKFGIQTATPVPADRLAVIDYILKHTYENSIHNMRTETKNTVYVTKDGKEAVYDADGNLVTDYNRGTYNYAPYEKPVDKFLLDFLPWLLLGVSRDDPTSFNERLYYYCLDLNWGIQRFIFLDDKSELEPLAYDDLTAKEKMVYQLFSYLLFNESYAIRLEDDTIPRLREDGDFYWAYVSQITQAVGLQND
ncbi:MAG: hypothetical protein K2H73_02825 [Treponemataceae bacterium]|nr:hypothetical protein [Treponemataceae bacterium]